MNRTKTRGRLILVTIIALFLAKCLYATFAISEDFWVWTYNGQAIFQGKLYLSVYTGPGLVYAAFYGIWDLLFHSAAALTFQLRVLSIRTQATSIPTAVLAFAFWMKLPMLMADGITVWLIVRTITKLTSSKYSGLIGGLLYSSSPLVFLSEVITTVDIYTAALILAGTAAIWFGRNVRGALFYALGTAFRLAPLIFLPVDLIGYARQRKIKPLLQVSGTQVALLALIGLIAYFWPGHVENSLFRLVPREVLYSLVPLVTSVGIFTLSITVAAIAAVIWIVTSPGFWESRQFGDDVLPVLSTYFAFSMFHPAFILWIVPILTVIAVSRGFGYLRYQIVMLGAWLFLMVQYSAVLSGFGRQVLLVPNMNAQMVRVSHALYQLGNISSLAILSRAAMSGSFAFIVLWTLAKMMTRRSHKQHAELGKNSTPNNGEKQPHATAREESL